MSVPFVQELSTTGVYGTGTTAIIGDYSSTAETFELKGPTGVADQTVCKRVIVYIRDGATPGFSASTYGAGTALTNGLTLAVTDSANNVVVPLTPDPILTNTHWGKVSYDVDVKQWGIGDEVLLCRWSFDKFAGDDGITLDDGAKLVLFCNDNLSGLTDQRITVEGYRSGKALNY